MEESKLTEEVESAVEENELLEIAIENPQPPKERQPFTKSLLYKFLLVFGGIYMTMIFVFQVWLTPIQVIGSSMQPTINLSIVSEEDEYHTDYVYFKEEDSYNNNDIVIIHNQDYKYIPYKEYIIDGNIYKQDIKYIIKRVIACPGQSITFYLKNETLTYGSNKTYYYGVIVKDKDGNIINNDESFIKEEMAISYIDYISTVYEPNNSGDAAFYKEIFENIVDHNNKNIEERVSKTFVVPEDSYFVMGDNRNNSDDSRKFGFVSKDTIEGSVKLQVKYGQNLWVAIFDKLKSIN